MAKRRSAKIAKSDNALKNLKGFQWGQTRTAELIPTGHHELDFYISRGLVEEMASSGKYDETKSGGIPTGILSMIYGGEGGGKSSLAYRICGHAQRMGKIPIWIDAENSFSEGLAKINGVDLDNIGRMHMYDEDDPDKIFDAETILDKMMELCQSGADVIVLDSVASIVPKYVMENEASKDTMAIMARVLGKTLPKLASYAAANNVLVIFINQLRVNPGVMFGDPEGTTGGKALAHMCSLILKITKRKSKDSIFYIESDDGQQEAIGGTAMVKIEKNRFAMPYPNVIDIPIYYKYYFPNVEEVIFQAGRQFNVIKKRLDTYSFNDMKHEGRSAFIEALSNASIDQIQPILEAITEAAAAKDIPLPPEITGYEDHLKYGQSDDESQPTKKHKVVKGAPKDNKSGSAAQEINVVDDNKL